MRILWLVVFLVALAVLLGSGSIPARADVKPHALFADNMVLQRNFATPIWGTASPNQSITLTIAGQTKQATAGADGKWMIKLDPVKEGGPYELTVSGPTSITYKNILFGDVWICSGQSNMEFQLKSANTAQAAIDASASPMLRLFTVKKNPAQAPANDVTGKWDESSPQTSPSFSAVGFFFGRELQKQLNVPIGLIHTSWGGTAIQLWQSKEAIEADPDMKVVLAEHQQRLDQYAASQKKYQQDLLATIRSGGMAQQLRLDRLGGLQKNAHIDAGAAQCLLQLRRQPPTAASSGNRIRKQQHGHKMANGKWKMVNGLTHYPFAIFPLPSVRLTDPSTALILHRFTHHFCELIRLWPK